MNNLFAGIGAFGFGFLLLAFRGFVVSRLWLWFIVPLGAPLISISWAIGIAVLVTMFAPISNKPAEKPTWDEVGKIFLRGMFSTLVSWGFGWLAHWFMVG
jgi:hypothetical protein